jgi:hypothetical protein
VFPIDDNFVVFSKDNEPGLTCVLANVLFFEPTDREPAHGQNSQLERRSKRRLRLLQGDNEDTRSDQDRVAAK